MGNDAEKMVGIVLNCEVETPIVVDTSLKIPFCLAMFLCSKRRVLGVAEEKPELFPKILLNPFGGFAKLS